MDDFRKNLLFLNLKAANQAEQAKKDLRDACHWAAEANNMALYSDRMDNKNAALRASTKLLHDLTEQCCLLIDASREFALDLSSIASESSKDMEDEDEE